MLTAAGMYGLLSDLPSKVLLPTYVVKSAPQIKASRAGTMVVNGVLLR